jgi:hypothetical protein
LPPSGINLVLLRVNLVKRRVRVDLLIEQRLRDGGIVHFTMPVAAIADQVNHHVTAKTVTVFNRHFAYPQNRFRVFRIHVEDWNGLALGQIR